MVYIYICVCIVNISYYYYVIFDHKLNVFECFSWSNHGPMGPFQFMLTKIPLNESLSKFNVNSDVTDVSHL